MTLVEACDSFIRSKKLAGLSPKTVKDYSEFLKPFITHCGNITVLELSQGIIESYLIRILEKDISKATKATYIRNLKIFLRWLSADHYVLFDYRKVKVPKSPKKKVRIYDVSEIETIFGMIHSQVEWIELRNKCIIALMLDSGVRQSEVCDLLRANVFFNNRYMVVRGKGDKERVVPLGDFSMNSLSAYLQVCPFDSKYVFVDRRGGVLTPNAVKLFVSRLSDAVPFDLSSHKLRHNFATNYCLDSYEANGMVDVYKLMAIMGHEDLSTTKKYLHHAAEIIATQEHLSHLDKIIQKGV